MTNKTSWFYQIYFGEGDFCFQDGKSWISVFTLYHISFTVSYGSYGILSLLFPVRSVWLNPLKSMSKFNFLGSLIQKKCS